MNLTTDERALLARSEEVEIETESAAGVVHRTIIWIVVDGEETFVRSVNGETARWYREAVAHPDVAILADGRRIPVRVEAAGDPESVARCTEALNVKYRGDASLGLSLLPATLPTTMRVVARA